MTTPRRRCGFSLLELLLAIAILALLVVLLNSMLSGVSKAWVRGEQQVDEFQNGRAALEILSRELSGAVISPNLQLVQNPILPSGLNQRANSDSMFWQALSNGTDRGDLAEIGYYLVEDHRFPGAEAYTLQRFFVPPSDTTNYQIFTPPNTPNGTSAPWVTSFIGNAVSTTVCGGVIAMWIRCFDVNGDVIPWLSGSGPGFGTLKYNSAARFTAAIRGQYSSFTYTGGTTANAHVLPSSVEFTIVTLDAKSFARNPYIPSQTTYVSPDTIPVARAAFESELVANHISTAQTFSTRIKLKGAPQ